MPWSTFDGFLPAPASPPPTTIAVRAIRPALASPRVKMAVLRLSPYVGASHPRAASAASHSCSSTGLRARKLMPSVPKFAALLDCGAPLKTSARQVISNATKPAATTVAANSASSRAPAIQPVHKSMFRLALSGTGFCTRMSPICRRPPGLRTRAISRKAASLSGIRLSTPLEMTTSAQPS